MKQRPQIPLAGHPAEPVGEFVEEFCVKPTFDADGVQASAGIGKDGKEYPDPQPLAPPVGFDAPPDLMTMIRTMMQHEKLKEIADREGFDSFEEAGDFDVEDDIPDPMTPHELLFYPPDERKPEPGSPPASSPPSPSQDASKAPGGAEGGVASPPPGHSHPTQYVYLIRTGLGDTTQT